MIPSMAAIVATLEFPPVSHLVEWRDLGGGINKIVLITFVACIAPLALFFIAGRKQAAVPKGTQNFVESFVDFVKDGIIEQTIGHDGEKWMPLLLSIFSFVFVCNIFEVVPFIQMPASARMAIPLMLALIVWLIYNVVGFQSQGIRYITNSIFPPGVPKALYILVTPIEFVSTFLVRPFSLAVRLFANMLAGHLLLVTFAVLSSTLWQRSFLAVIWPLPTVMLIVLTGFEVLVALLQAFIFTMLTAVYIGGSAHPEH